MRRNSYQYVFGALLAVSGCSPETGPAGKGGASNAPPSAPVTVTQISVENNLGIVSLTPEAEARLAIATVPIETRPVDRRRLYGGRVVTPPDNRAVLSAPVAGTFVSLADSGGGPLGPGSRVAKGQALYSFLPFQSSEDSGLTPAERAQLAVSELTMARARAEACNVMR